MNQVAQTRTTRAPYQWERKKCFGNPAHRLSPFTTAILAEVLLAKVKIANLQEYDGKGDPQDHLDRFYAKVDLYEFSDATYSKIFGTTLASWAFAWFNKLPTDSLKTRTTHPAFSPSVIHQQKIP